MVVRSLRLMAPLNLSFAACGFLGIYQLGAVKAFMRHGERLMASLQACSGASAGALVAAVVVTAPDKLQDCTDFTLSLADSVRRRFFGAFTPGFDLMLALREGLEDILPGNAHCRAKDRLHVSITHSRTGQNRTVSQFESRDQLVSVLLASSFVPVYAGFQAVEFQGERWVDGGFSDALPKPLPLGGRTITVSPFFGLQDVCPLHKGRSAPRHLRLANMDLTFSVENLKRLNQSLFPPSNSQMHELRQQGFHDAVRFLKAESWMN